MIRTLILLFAPILFAHPQVFRWLAGASWVALPTTKTKWPSCTRITATIRGRALLFGLMLLVSSNLWAQFKIPPKPKLEDQTSVYDYANLFSETQKTQLEQKLIQYADSTSTQMVVITVKSLNGEYEGILAPRWAQEWGIGQKGQDNGLIMLIAKEERKVWISPGYGIEETLTAGQTGTIIRYTVIPNFKKGLYYQGVNEALDVIKDMILGQYKLQAPKPKETSWWPVIIFLGFFGLILYLSAKYGDKLPPPSSGSRGSMGGGPIILSGGGTRFGSGGFGSRGGGFSGGFGGGGFSGGGAGGSW